jgi:type IV pilus assembly protein PilB
MLLKRRGVVTEQQLQSALAIQQGRSPDKRLGEILIEQGYATERDLGAARAASVGLPFAMLTLRMVNPDAMRHLPQEFCEKHNLLPVSSVDDWLTVAVEEFTNVYLVDEIKRLSRKNVQVLAALGENIRQVRIGITGAPPSSATQSQPAAAEDATASGTIQSELDELLIVSAEKKEEENADLQVAAAGSPIVKLVNHIIRTAVESKASDIHIEPEENEFRIRYRIDGASARLALSCFNSST